ncbi:MAG: deiodinase-like protein [Phycisphaerae bacterium]
MKRNQWLFRSLTLGLVAGAGLCLTPSQLAAAPEGARKDAPARGERPERGQAGPQEPGQRLDQMVERLRERLAGAGLSDEQQTQVDAILADARAEVQSLAPTLQGMPREEIRDEMMVLMGETRTKLAAVLSDEQKAKLGAGARGAGGQRGAGEAGNAAGGREGRAGGALFARMKQHLDELDLSPEQKTKVTGILENAGKELAGLREGNDDPTALREKAREIAGKVRTDIAAVLSDEQKAQLQEKMRAGLGPNGQERSGLQRGAGVGEGGGAENAGVAPGGPGPKAVGPAATDTARPAQLLGALTVGQEVPDITLYQPDGRPVRLASYRGKPLVIAFGSYSSPLFRERVPEVQQLFQRYRRQANVIYVYTAEAHPDGQWQVQRNLDAGIAVPAHGSLADRRTAARVARDQLKIEVPVVVEDMDAPISGAFDAFPNGAVVIDARGVLVGRQKWLEPIALERMLNEALGR